MRSPSRAALPNTTALPVAEASAEASAAAPAEAGMPPAISSGAKVANTPAKPNASPTTVRGVSRSPAISRWANSEVNSG